MTHLTFFLAVRTLLFVFFFVVLCEEALFQMSAFIVNVAPLLDSGLFSRYCTYVTPIRAWTRIKLCACAEGEVAV